MDVLERIKGQVENNPIIILSLIHISEPTRPKR